MSDAEQNGFIQILIRDLTAEMLRAASTKDEIQRRSVVRSGFAVRTVIGCIDGCTNIKLRDSSLLENARWRAAIT
jgi:hypothetical protein